MLSTIIAEDDLGNVNMIAESFLSQDANESIKCEDGTITVYGKGNRIFAVKMHNTRWRSRTCIYTNFKYVVQSQARAR